MKTSQEIWDVNVTKTSKTGRRFRPLGPLAYGEHIHGINMEEVNDDEGNAPAKTDKPEPAFLGGGTGGRNPGQSAAAPAAALSGTAHLKSVQCIKKMVKSWFLERLVSVTRQDLFFALITQNVDFSVTPIYVWRWGCTIR